MSAVSIPAPLSQIGPARALARAVRAEASKALSGVVFWTTVILSLAATVAVALGIASIAAAAEARGVEGAAVLTPQFTLIGLLTVGAVALLSFSAWLVVGEQVGRTAGVTAVVMPDRVVVLIAKAVVAAMTTLATTAILVPVGFLVAGTVYSGAIALPEGFADGAGMRLWATLPLVFAALAVTSVGLGALVRNAPVAIAIVIVWYGIAEDWIARIPFVGDAVQPVLPVSLAHTLAGVQGDAAALPGGAAGGAALLVVVAAVVLIAGAIRTSRGDVRT